MSDRDQPWTPSEVDVVLLDSQRRADSAIAYAKSYWKRGHEPESQHALHVLALEVETLRAKLSNQDRPAPHVPAPTVRIVAHPHGKTQALIDALLVRANERGVRVEIVRTAGHDQAKGDDDV